jgi:sugar O-acyltransferase (sialic acid O-acetyltransferase NeuD family)
MKEYGVEFEIKGFLDDKTDALEGYQDYPPILDSVENYQIQPDDVFACALGDVRYKKKYVQIILDKGGEFMNVIHATAIIRKNAKMGKGCIVDNFSSIDCDATIGDFVTIQAHCTVGHDTKIGAWSMLDCFAFMGGFSELGESVTLHTRTTLIPHKKVGDNAIVNAGSVVIRDVPENALMMGNPAKPMLVPKIENVIIK